MKQPLCWLRAACALKKDCKQNLGVDSMTRFIVNYFGEKHCNIPADRIEERNGFVFAFNENSLVGIFDLSVTDTCYLSRDAKD